MQPQHLNHPKLEMVITSRERDIGGFSVRRILPYATHRMVGPFIFFDHMGPAEFLPGQGVDVRPHPHINLATVTYLFEGKIRHQDSLGSDQNIEPGAINWMTAGTGIVHSERAPLEKSGLTNRMNGIQLWVALPEDKEETAPSFYHHPKNTLPEFEVEGVHLKLLLGEAFGKKSPVQVMSDMFYVDAAFEEGQELTLPAGTRETAVYLAEGEIEVEDIRLDSFSMAVGKRSQDLKIRALKKSRVLLLGGDPVGPRHIYWNFVSSSKDRIEQAKQAWLQGPSETNPRFKPIPNDQNEFIPLPQDPNPKGTKM